MKKPSGNTIFLIIASLLVAGGLYWYFFSGTSATDAPLSAGAAAPISVAQAKFDTLTSQLGPISFNLAIFSDPRFTALVDLTTPVSEEPIGRKDPFAPIPGVSTKTTQ